MQALVQKLTKTRKIRIKSVVTIDNSIIKRLNGWDMFKKISGMKGYVNPLLRRTPNHFILHVGTNDLNSNQTTEVIAKKISYLATSLKNNQQHVCVSNIIF